MDVCHPIIHRTRLRKRHLLKFVVTACLLQSLTPAALILYDSQLPRFVIGLSCLVFFAHTIFVYVKIARTIQIKVRAGENQQDADGKRKPAQYLREIKATKTCFLVAPCCVVCKVVPAVNTFSNVVRIKSIIETMLLRRGYAVLLFLNSSLNSFILFWKNKKLSECIPKNCLNVVKISGLNVVHPS